eukprot:m.173157 g.173157  ORF g.173157 m.173157 type:complete len:138 (-) comp13651_c0_seq1:210-623(-)
MAVATRHPHHLHPPSAHPHHLHPASFCGGYRTQHGHVQHSNPAGADGGAPMCVDEPQVPRHNAPAGKVPSASLTDEARKQARTEQMLRLMLLASAKNKRHSKKKMPVRQLVLQRQFCDVLTSTYQNLKQADAVHRIL